MHNEWQSFLDKLKKDKNPLYDLLKDCSISDDFTIYVPNEEKKNQVKAKLNNIKSKMPPHWGNKRINVDIGQIPKTIPTAPQPIKKISIPTKPISVRNPLQSLNFANFEVDKRGNELAKPVLEAAVSAEKTCATVYNHLTERTKRIAGANVIIAEFPWRVRVGGMRGFRELLLPAFHPVYGIPYITSSSLKGAVLAAAKNLKLDTEAEIKRILGTLEGGIGTVQILDAFPTAPCLSLDIANPQWHWQENLVKYNAVPHTLLSMEQPKILIGLIPTSRVLNIEGAQSDINKVKSWLDKALSLGIGSRVSSGYGRLSNIQNLPYSSSHNFELWTQGMYGAINDKPEFRPVALRGMLRYWFRALALGIYSPAECKELEATLFGTIEPKSREGSIRIAVELEKHPPQRDLYYYKGKILLEAKTPEHLTLIEKILQLSSHLAGIGRGSRRPLHWNSPKMRGCHFQLNDFILSCDKTAWKDFIAQVRAALIAISSSKQAPVATKPDNPRSQDILNNQTHIYITINQDLQHPKTVTDWKNKGNIPTVRGKALELLYGNNQFKGVNREGIGNPQVGGDFGIPSFVLIKSNFPTTDNYQTVTIFGVNNNHRAKFVEALGADYIRVW